jgi:hypothetical protein
LKTEEKKVQVEETEEEETEEEETEEEETEEEEDETSRALAILEEVVAEQAEVIAAEKK